MLSERVVEDSVGVKNRCNSLHIFASPSKSHNGKPQYADKVLISERAMEDQDIKPQISAQIFLSPSKSRNGKPEYALNICKF